MLVDLFLSDHLDSLDVLFRRHYRMARLKTLHGLGDLLDKAVMLFDAANNVSGCLADDQPVIFNGKGYNVHGNVKYHDKERAEASQNCPAN